VKKFLPYIIVTVVLLLLIWIVIQSKRNNHVFDEHITLNKSDKIPYGTYVAYNNLSHLFPNASIVINDKQPGLLDSANSSDKQALIIITPWFRADEYEMKKLINFVRRGNNVFVSTAILSYDVQNILHCESPGVYDINDNLALDNNLDSFSVSLINPPFSEDQEYGCPGLRYESYFSKYDSTITTVFGNGIYILPNFIQLKADKGSIYFHLTPLSFSNYFLLHDKNMNYYDKALSVIPRETKKLIWDEYYLHKRYYDGYNGGTRGRRNNSMISVLMKNPSFRAGLLVLTILVLLFVLQEMRRKQRMIPVVTRPGNDSLDFVKTIGRLYHEKGNHIDLARKMSAYFLEHIRNKYKLSTGSLDEEFVLAVQKKTGQQENIVREIVSFIKYIQDDPDITDEQLADFHKQLEEFYKVA
jgi:hypothetical protein